MVTFYDADYYNTLVKSGELEEGNCAGFAAGISGPIYLYRSVDPDTNRPLKGTPVNSFIQEFKEHGINLVQVSSLEETESKIAFVLWGWYAYKDPFFGMKYDDFHVVRKNPDGSFEHKPDGHNPACKVTLEEVSREYHEKPYYLMMV